MFMKGETKMRITPIKSYEPSFGRPSANPRINKQVVPTQQQQQPLDTDTLTKIILKTPKLFFTKY